MEQAVVESHKFTALTALDIKGQVQLIQEVMAAVMEDGHHYGTIPGTPKPTLLKPGAEKLSLTFRLRPEYDLLPQSILSERVRTYRLKCRLVHIHTGESWGEGVGSCSSDESKFKKQERSVDDLDNTIFKMAAKRAHVAAVLSATAASDLFTQDLEDLNSLSNEQEDTERMLPFGKHRGKPLTEIPADYLLWLVGDMEAKKQQPQLQAAIHAELATRNKPPLPAPKSDVNLFEYAKLQITQAKSKGVAIAARAQYTGDARLGVDEQVALDDAFNEKWSPPLDEIEPEPRR